MKSTYVNLGFITAHLRKQTVSFRIKTIVDFDFLNQCASGGYGVGDTLIIIGSTILKDLVEDGHFFL